MQPNEYFWLDIVFSVGILAIIGYFVYWTVKVCKGWFKASIIGLWLWLSRDAFFVRLPHYLGWNDLAEFFNGYATRAAFFFLGMLCLIIGSGMDIFTKYLQKRGVQIGLVRIEETTKEEKSDE